MGVLEGGEGRDMRAASYCMTPSNLFDDDITYCSFVVLWYSEVLFLFLLQTISVDL